MIVPFYRRRRRAVAAGAARGHHGPPGPPIQTFQGALVYNASDKTTQNYSGGSGTIITWDSEVYDPDGCHSTSSNTSRITVPSAYNGMYGVFQAVFDMSLIAAATTVWAQILKNNSTSFDGYGSAMHHNGTFGGASMQCCTLPVLLTTGDYYEAQLYCSDTSITLDAAVSSFGLHVVG